MLTVRNVPVVEPTPQGAWELVFWMGEASDFSIAFRGLLDEISRLMGEEPEQALMMPPYEEGEDFVEGLLRFGAHRVSIYYEYSLGYLALFNATRVPLDIIAAKVRLAANLL